MKSKKLQRLRRARKSRAKMAELNRVRLCVYRTPRHTYAQIIDDSGSRVLASASTLDNSWGTEQGSGGNCGAAELIGKTIAERALAAGISEVAFDRSGFKYHGRIKALADAARANGLQF
ncbi:MAG: 50S ribosomal protein L18 [Gammaproteobacteria bacterium]|nr:50S ribosomal protein L18 [Gammaproteobacteria bacterium]